MRAMHRQPRDRCRATVLGAAALSIGLIGILPAAVSADDVARHPTARAAPMIPAPTNPAPRQSTDELRLELIEQTFAFAPDGDLDLEYRLTGDLATIGKGEILITG